MLIILIFTREKSAKPILLAMRLVLVLLATFLQSLFNFFTLQNLIGLYAFNNIRRRQMLAIAAVYRHRRRQRRRRNRLRYWCLPRPRQSWFEIHYNDHRIPDDYFKQQLRVRRATFNELLNMVNPHVARQDTSMRNCIPPEKILAIGLYRLAHGNSYVSIAPVFNVGKSTVIEAVQDVMNVLYDQRNQYIKFPTTIAETTECIETFQRTRSELPNVVGAIDGTHIPIIAPRVDAVDYFSRYQQHDMIVQGVVNGTGKFIDAVAGFPGSAHDARVLRNSNIYQEAENGNILQAPLVNIDGNDIGPYLVGDSAYPLAPWLIKPFPEGTNDPDEKTFNKELSRARVVVERAFGILKGRWRVLQKRLDSSLNFAIKTTIACIVLHNFCIEANDDWDDDDDDGPSDNDGNNNLVFGDADEIRGVLKDFVCGNV